MPNDHTSRAEFYSENLVKRTSGAIKTLSRALLENDF